MLGIFLDIETNGLNAYRHHAIEIAFKILDVQTGIEKAQYHTVITQPKEAWLESDPASIHVNGFSWNEVKSGLPLDVVRERIIEIFESVDIKRGSSVFICQNPSFDRAFFTHIIDTETQEKLNWPYHWLDLASMHWVKCLLGKSDLPWNIGLSKNKIAEYYGLPPESSPHRAMNGVDHLILCYKHVVGI